MPDFSKPADRTLVAQGHMIKAASNQLEFVIRRDYADQENEEKHILPSKAKRESRSRVKEIFSLTHWKISI